MRNATRWRGKPIARYRLARVDGQGSPFELPKLAQHPFCVLDLGEDGARLGQEGPSGLG